ncbi:Ribosomal RNA small subunit methyltransferase H [Thalassoporum mexicanum PCC 7367]|uniref:16S rRNA (cytosine(1402)-N(4))-methyltransferase RsmH n=1 Tax=Thalassoporum mexicanum TaxID=3457544 RepID=UPI00029FF0EC|nr:16S rRNA (cytosine(1402)-N(4))-methyltransferase RsmH [Pseudanabaena sp. PCC 7367]AFY68725.1 Ribosomal RNA small subunit methyltransferase H [Pseudanabaena sp. PCC 7367]
MSSEFHHIPVLAKPLIAGLGEIVDRGFYLDCTVGGGGHSKLILEQAKAEGKNISLVAIDRDQMAIAAAQQNLIEYGDRVQFWHGNYCEYEPGAVKFAGIIADLGVSSAQIDLPERGFSFQAKGDLDMRMDRTEETTAADLINHAAEVELANIFYNYGEERLSRRIARAIVSQRPLHTTTELAQVIAKAVPGRYRHGRINPATRVFQALRIAVNRELESLETWLAKAPDWLAADGIIAVISFHSLEDRIVKHTFRQDDRLQVLTKKPIIAEAEEIAVNSRSRSAKLRLARRLVV